MSVKSILKLSKFRESKKKEKSYPGACPVVHVSTYPMKMASHKKKKEADSGSSNAQALRGQKNDQGC